MHVNKEEAKTIAILERKLGRLLDTLELIIFHSAGLGEERLMPRARVKYQAVLKFISENSN